ncbi:MAG TPA: YrrS family protein [Planococcus sp. (in: firmicutes)]|nr:YrrS family protein [Planococcus sp. (in: firmicutes)]
MTNEDKRYPSRLKKKSKTRSNSVLNVMIGLVFTLILITGAFIFMDQNSQDTQQPESVRIASDTEDAEASDSEEAATDEEDATEETTDTEENTAEEEQAGAEAESEETEEQTEEGSVTVGGTITREESNDPIVEETVINTSWEPIGTSQSGNHVSAYDQSSVDWKEKVGAISYATGLGENEMYVMMIQNGGGPQKSIGTVTSKDKSEKYRVHLEWVDGEGWKPVKMDVLKTLEGAY